MNQLLEYRKIYLANPDVYFIQTVNKTNGNVGVGSFHTNGEDKIIVFEGDSSGKDDASYTFDEFLEKV